MSSLSPLHLSNFVYFFQSNVLKFASHCPIESASTLYFAMKKKPNRSSISFKPHLAFNPIYLIVVLRSSLTFTQYKARKNYRCFCSDSSLNDRRRPIRSVQNKAINVWLENAVKNTSHSTYSIHFILCLWDEFFVSLILKFMSFNLDVGLFCVFNAINGVECYTPGFDGDYWLTNCLANY